MYELYQGSSTGPGLGISDLDITAFARGGPVAKGETRMFDTLLSDAAVNTLNTFATDSAWRNLIVPTAARLARGFFAVALEAIADDTEGRWRVYGKVDAIVQKSSGNIAIGDDLVASPGSRLDADLVAPGAGSGSGDVVVGAKVIAFAREAVTGPIAGQLAEVQFDGLGGYGWNVLS